MNNSFSRFRNVNSIIHKIDPVTKLIAFLALSITIFLAQTPLTLGIMLSSVIIMALIGRVRLKSFFNILLFIIPFFIFMFIIYGLVLFDVLEALGFVFYMSMRLYLFLLMSIVYTSTTKEIDIARSIEWLITPLKFIKVPTYEISMMITLAIRFIPVLINDMFMILRAQTSRGINVINGTFRTRIKGIINSLLPMFVISFRRADDLAIAMDVRKYQTKQKRTKYWKNKFFILEFITLLFVGSLMTAVIIVGGL